MLEDKSALHCKVEAMHILYHPGILSYTPRETQTHALGDMQKNVHSSIVLNNQKIGNNLMSIDRKMVNELLSSHIKMNELQLLTKTSVNLRNIIVKRQTSVAKFLFKPFIEIEYTYAKEYMCVVDEFS